MIRRAAFIYDDKLADHVLSETHPMKPVRLRYTYELLQAYHAFGSTGSKVTEPRLATEDEVLRFHTRPYLDAVKAVSECDRSDYQVEFGLGSGDNPVYAGMYEAARLSTGASLKGAQMLASGEMNAVFNISGGLHHAMPGYASGFCLFNDPVLAIMELQSRGMKVAYVDVDCHHGDGVQQAFYDNDQVLTISMHESGRFLFPGTGFTSEVGTGHGLGYSVNVPLYPYTTDDIYCWAFGEVVEPLIEAFRPDVLVTQLGVDSHFLDPITHLALTVQGFGRIVEKLSRFASLWLALGGGGYDLQAVARAWTLAYSKMTDQEFAQELPTSYAERHDIFELMDPKEPLIKNSTRKDAQIFAEESVRSIQRMVFPIHGIIRGG